MSESHPENAPALLIVENLVKYYPVTSGLFRKADSWVKAVDGVSFTIPAGTTLGLVGESGCGKTTLGRTILGLTPATSGRVYLDGQPLFELGGKALKQMRRDMQIIFQDPFASLNPSMSVGESIAEGLMAHGIGNRDERHEAVMELLRIVGLHPSHARRYPHEFSGGQCQRIGIARALGLKPKFLVLDEPVSALDVSIQSQIINILADLQKEFNLTYLFIGHDLSVVEHISDMVAVMYLGKMVELAPRRRLFRQPFHPYTQALLSAIPIPDPTVRRKRILLRGDVPSPVNPPRACRFHTRCPQVMPRCSVEEPPFEEIAPGHWTACWLWDELEGRQSSHEKVTK